jgi:O-antigen ligase
VDRRVWYRLFYLLVLLGGMANLVMSQSRSGWLSCAVALAVLGALMARRDRVKRRIVRPAIAAAVLTLGVLLAFAGPIATRLLDSNPIAIDGRIEYARTAWGMIRAKPIFGWGLNSYVFEAPAFTRWGARGAKEFYEKSKNWLPPVHNIYLLWWSELGVIGLLMHLTLIGWMIRTAVRNLRVESDMLFAINIACIVGIVALLIDGMLSFTLRINSVLRDVWVMAALIYAVRYWRLANPSEPLPT